jgi:hypothetical protein
MSQSQIPDSFSQGSQQQQQSQQQQPVASSSTLPPPQPIPEPQEDYSRRYNNLLKALEVAVRKGTNKWTCVSPSCSPSLSCSAWLGGSLALNADCPAVAFTGASVASRQLRRLQADVSLALQALP